MPVFFTYSHEDKEFVDRLARQLVDKKAWVWIDRWELKVGDSIVERVQTALQEASAVVVVLSPASVTSGWVQREISSVLYKEVQNKQSLIIPVLTKDCQIPAFLIDRLYADFRTNFDDGLRTLLESLARVINATQGRTQTPNFFTDWAFDWTVEPAPLRGRVTLIDHSKDLDFAILTQIEITGNDEATKRFCSYAEAGLAWIHKGPILDSLVTWAQSIGPNITLTDSHPRVIKGAVGDKLQAISYDVELTARWVGTDTGKDIIFALSDNLHRVVEQWKRCIRPPTKDEIRRGMEIWLKLNSSSQ